MKEFVAPVVLEIEDLAEGVYAASGFNETDIPVAPSQPDVTSDCWTINVYRDQQEAGGYSTWRVDCRHSHAVQHISSCTRIFINFNGPVTAAQLEGYVSEISGNTVYLTRASHANAYKAGDNFNCLLKIWADDYRNIALINYGIDCTHQTNVQGYFD